MHLLRSMALAFCLAFSLSLPGAPGIICEIRPTTTDLLFSGVTPGGTLVLFGISAFTEHGVPTKARTAELLADEDGDGQVTWQPKYGIPLRSMWVAIDVADGTRCTVSPADYPIPNRQIPERRFVAGADGIFSALRMERQSVDLLLVRPGEGAWFLQAREGGPKDADGVADGSLRLSFGAAAKLKDAYAAAPATVQPGDVLATIESGHMEMTITTVIVDRELP